MFFFGKALLTVATLASLDSAKADFKGLDRKSNVGRTKGVGLRRQDQPNRSLIVGGTPVDTPGYFVDLGICGGTLIHEDILLTAAHCNNPWLSGNALVGPTYEFRELKSGTMHPEYGTNVLDYDFMVVKIDKIDNPTLVDLNSNGAIPALNDDILIMGTGLKSASDSGNDFTFTETTVQVVSQPQCLASYLTIDVPVTDNMFCAAAPGKDSCDRDSGGPAIVGGNTQVGIVSFGLGCADPEFPGVYSKVSVAYDWIQRQICCQSENPPSDCPVVDASECPNDLGGFPPLCFQAIDIDTGKCTGNAFASPTGTIEGCRDNSDFTEPGRKIDFPFFDSGDGNCVMVPGVSPVGDCCKTDLCDRGDADYIPGIPDDPDADCANRFNLNDCPAGYDSYFFDHSIRSCTSISSNSGGDPHIQTFDGKFFDYMGECDLVLVSAAEFDLDIHIRTTSRYQYSYIEAAVIRIGENTLEVSSHGDYALDGIGAANLTGNAKLAQYPIYHSVPSEKRHVFDVVLGPHQNITLSTFKDLVSVKISEGSRDVFGDSVGLMGSFKGELLARDGSPLSLESDGVNAIGQEWQVLESEPMLFRTARAPFAGEKCILPSVATKQRRLGESKLSQTDAERACGDFSGQQFDNCVFDVMAVGDVDLAQAGGY